MSTPRWDGTAKATREQAVEEWRLHFLEHLNRAEAFVNEPIHLREQMRVSLALELAKDVVNTVEQAVRANAGRGMP